MSAEYFTVSDEMLEYPDDECPTCKGAGFVVTQSISAVPCPNCGGYPDEWEDADASN